jgi:hypothetical protein
MNKKTVADPSPRVAYLESKRQLCRALMGGTDEMIAQGQTWLPKHPAESEKNYQLRLKGNILTNFLEQAVDKAAGKIFSKPIALGENVPPDITTLCENIDRQGRGLDAFMMDVTKSTFTDGVSFILGDMPPDTGAQTLADEKAMGKRPYAIHVKAENILETVSEMIGGVDTLTRVRIRECTSKPVPDSWEYATIDQVRVLELVQVEDGYRVAYSLWQQAKESKDWMKVEEGLTTFQRIALVPVYTNRVGFCEGLPPFRSTAELNLRHWRSMAEQINALTFQRFAMLSAVGVSEDSTIETGPSKLLKSPNPEAKYAYVEPTGKGVEMGRLDLESIEAAIETASVNLRIERAGEVTATAAALDSAECNAGLKAVAGGIGDSIEQLFQHFAMMLGLGPDAGGEVAVNDDFGERKGTDAGLQEIGKYRALGDISRTQALQTLIWRGELPPDFDIELNAEEIDSEGPPLASFTNNNDGGQGAQQ